MEFTVDPTTTRRGWERWAGLNTSVTNRGLELATRPTVRDTDLGFTAVDLALDIGDNLFALADDGRVGRYDPERKVLEPVRLDADPAADGPARALALTVDAIYVFTATRITAFSRHTLARRWAMESPVDSLTSVAAHDRTVYVLDGSAGVVTALGPTPELRRVVTGLLSPSALAVDDGDLYVLNGGGDDTTVRRFGPDYEEHVERFPLPVTLPREGGAIDDPCLAVRGPECLVLSGRRSVDGSALLARYRPEAGFELLSGVDEPSRRLVLARGSTADGLSGYAVAAADGAVSRLSERTATRRNPDSGRYDGVALGRFDAGSEATRWHRLTVDIDGVTASTQVRVAYFASDTLLDGPPVAALDGVDSAAAERLGNANVDDCRTLTALSTRRLADLLGTSERGARSVQAAATAELAARWTDRELTVETPNPRDVLLDDARGRYLYVRLSLYGSRDDSPRVVGVRAYRPRRSYTRYLPELYQEQSGFLERFLALFESAFADIEHDIETTTRYLDPAGVPSDAVDWLGRWLAVATDQTWPEAARREFIARAPALYRQRGTRAGLLAVCSLYLDYVEPADDTDTPYLGVLEASELDAADDSAVTTAYEEALASPQSALVFVGPTVDEDHVRGVEAIVTRETPAHVAVSTVGLSSRCRLDTHTYLGVNSALPRRDLVLDDSVLGQNAVLGGRGDVD